MIPFLSKAKKSSFKIKIIQVFILLIFITIFGLSFLYYYRSTDIILDLSDQTAREISDKIVERTINYIEVPAVQTKTLSNLIGDQKIIPHHQEIWKYAWEQLLVFPQVQSIFVADFSGNYVQVRREPKFATRYIDRSMGTGKEKWLYRDQDYNLISELTRIPTFDPRTRPWFKNTKKDKRIYWTDVYVFTTAQTPGISASYPVLNKEGELVAVTCVNSPLHSLSTFLAEQHITENSIILLTNEKDELIAYPKGEYTSRIDHKTGKRRLSLVTELADPWVADAFQTYRDRQKNPNSRETNKNWVMRYLEKFSQGKFPSLQEVFHYPDRKFSVSTTEGKRYITYSTPFPKSFSTNWEVVIILPEEDLISSIQNLRRTGMIASLAFVIIALFFIYTFINALTRSLIRLAKETQKISHFNLDEIEDVPSTIQEVDMMNNALQTAVSGLQSFKKYVPDTLVRQLIEAGEEVQLGGKEAELTILFSDIEGFTSITEKLPANELASHLSDYMEHLSGNIIENKGTIDKYIGDAIMAFWGAPLPLDNAPYKACKSALECQKILKQLNKQWEKEGKFPMNTRMGIHTGTTIVGNMGSKERMNYTIIGNSTNLAARLEGINKIYGTSIIISEDTYFQVSQHFFCRLLDYIAVKGQEKPHVIYELISSVDEPVPDDIRYLKEKYEFGLQVYQEQKWDEAIQIFRALQDRYPEDLAVLEMLSRCIRYQKEPDLIHPDWDGVHAFHQK